MVLLVFMLLDFTTVGQKRRRVWERVCERENVGKRDRGGSGEKEGEKDNRRERGKKEWKK